MTNLLSRLSSAPVAANYRKKNKKTFLLFCFLPVFRIKENGNA